MANYLTTDTELESVANAIRTAGGTSADLAYPAGFLTAIASLSGGGGGSDNIKTGIHHTCENNDYSYVSDSISHGYTGSGWPLYVFLCAKNGLDDTTNSAYAAKLQKNIIGILVAIKEEVTTAPATTTGEGSNTYARVFRVYKSNATSATTYSNGTLAHSFMYNTGSPKTGTWDEVIKWNHNTKELQVCVAQDGGTALALMPDTDYFYCIVFSS